MKKILTVLAVMAAVVCIAGPHRSPQHRHHSPRIVHRSPPPRPAPMPHRPHHHHHFWGRGGSNFWPGFTGGLVGSIFAQGLTPPPPSSTVIVNPVWVPPVYGIRPVYDSFGRVIRYEQYIITPGYWK